MFSFLFRLVKVLRRALVQQSWRNSAKARSASQIGVYRTSSIVDHRFMPIRRHSLAQPMQVFTGTAMKIHDFKAKSATERGSRLGSDYN